MGASEAYRVQATLQSSNAENELHHIAERGIQQTAHTCWVGDDKQFTEGWDSFL